MAVEELAQELLTELLALDPINASLLGLADYDELLPDFSEAGEVRSGQRLADIAERSTHVATEDLSEMDRQSLDFVAHHAAVYRDASAVPMLEWTIGDFHGAPVASVLSQLPDVSLNSAERQSGYLDRLAALPNLLEQAGERHRLGQAHGRPAVLRLVRSAIAQLDFILADPALSGIVHDQRETDSTFQARRQDELIDKDVRPAIASYRDLLEHEVAPHARDDDHPGLCHIVDGLHFYEALSALHTSSKYRAEELHEIGLRIVEEVREEFTVLGERLWQIGEPREMFTRLREDRALRYRTSEEVLDAAKAAVRRAEAAAPRWFATVPDEPCLVEAVPPAQQAGSAPAYYLSGALDGSRQGTFFINASRPGERFRHMAETVAFHEAVPGHHLQITVGLREDSLPLARRLIRDTACSEGWGLYAERLAEEMDLYSSDITRLGMLSADAWRAARLVVDTGLHALGWTRAQAVSWMNENTALAPIEIESEIDRYITYPRQALSYMVGRLAIDELRSQASDALGTSFDLREFHDFILRVGALPLSALRAAVTRYIATKAP